MEFALVPTVSGGDVPDGADADHPPLLGGELIGHGGAALRLYMGMTPGQHEQFEIMGQVEAPLVRCGRYWALKTTGGAAAASVVQAHPQLALRDVVLIPVTVTHLGLLRLLQSGHLYCADATQWHLYGALRRPSPRNDGGHVYYKVHPNTQLM
jgi:hypothetical protein